MNCRKISDRIRLFPAIAVLLALMILLPAGCTTNPVTPAPQLASRLAPEWIAAAHRVRSRDRTIYYHGQASGVAAGNAKNWAGTVRGEILALDPAMAIVIPAGSLTLTPGGGIKIEGSHQVMMTDAPAWKHLLLP